MQTKRATLIIFFLHNTRVIPLLIKVSESFEIQVNILEILRNKQSKIIVTTYPKVGVSCYSTGGKLLTLYNSTLSTVWPSQTGYKVHMCLRGYVGDWRKSGGGGMGDVSPTFLVGGWPVQIFPYFLKIR